MYEYVEEMDNQNEIAEWKLNAFTQDLLQLKKFVEIAEKKNALWSLNGVRENLIKLANSYIDTMLNKLAEKQTKEEIEKNSVIVSLLTRHIQDPNIPLSWEIVTAIADEHRASIAWSVWFLVQEIGNRPWMFWKAVKWIWEKAGVA